MNRVSKYLLAVIFNLYLSGCAINSVNITDCDTSNPRGESLPPSKAVNNNLTYSLHNSRYTTIGDLSSVNMEGKDKQITTKVEGMILAIAQVTIDNSGGTSVRGNCRVLIGEGDARDENMSTISGSAVWRTIEDSAYRLTLPIVAHAVKSAGTYNVVVECEQGAAEGGTRATLTNLIVWQAGDR